MICLHRHWNEGGDRPAGRWCTDCGAKIVKRRRAVDEILNTKARERRWAQQYTAAQLALFKKRD